MTTPPLCPPIALPAELPQLTHSLGWGAGAWQNLKGGRTNEIWKFTRAGDANDKAYVCKIYNPDAPNPMFPNDPTAEITVLQTLSGTGFAAEFIGQTQIKDKTCVVYRYVPGSPLGTCNTELIHQLFKLHQQNAPDRLRRIPSGGAAIITAGDRLIANDTSRLAQSLRRSKPTLPRIPPCKPVFLHGDPIPMNVISHEGQLTFIDWQCPAIGDPVEDLNLALSPAMHVVYGHTPPDQATINACLDQYGSPQIIERYHALSSALRWRMACYCAWKIAQGENIYAEAVEAEFSQS